MKEKNIRLTIAYNGNMFSGWQRQKNEDSIQEAIEKALKKIIGEDIKVIGCGRTDSKVHAISYTANFQTASHLAPEQIEKALNSLLPTDIHIKKTEVASSEFHSRYSAKKKTYRYLIICGQKSPFLQNFAYYIRDTLNIDYMKKATEHFLGEHDFSAFQAAGSNILNSKRKIYRIVVREEKFTIDSELKIISIEITANGFLYKMARNIVGTLIYVGLGKLSVKKVAGLIASRDRRQAPPTAPPEGLYLKKVVY